MAVSYEDIDDWVNDDDYDGGSSSYIGNERYFQVLYNDVDFLIPQTMTREYNMGNGDNPNSDLATCIVIGGTYGFIVNGTTPPQFNLYADFYDRLELVAGDISDYMAEKGNNSTKEEFELALLDYLALEFGYSAEEMYHNCIPQ